MDNYAFRLGSIPVICGGRIGFRSLGVLLPEIAENAVAHGAAGKRAP